MNVTMSSFSGAAPFLLADTQRAPRASCLRSFAWPQALALVVAIGGCAPDTSSTPKSGSRMPSSIVEPYLHIQAALAHDSIDHVRANAGHIATAASALGAPAVKIDTAAVQLASATEIADARDKFGTLSDAMVTYMGGLNLTAPEGVRVAYCPMKQKPWLQQGSTIANPYYGSAMPSCGDFR